MDKEFKQFLKSLKFPLLAVGLLWAVKIYEIISGTSLTRLGIYPRERDGLVGILTSPFIHSGWEHLISNTFPILIMTTIMIHFFRKVAVYAYIFITLLTGLLVWLFGRESYHIGASGVIYGLITFVFFTGILRKSVRSMALAFIVFTLYSGYFEGFAPKAGVSWESHLLGAVAGAMFAFLVKNVKEDDDDEELKPEIPQSRSYFLPRDIFDKTKHQRLLEEQYRQEQLRLERERLEQEWRERSRS